MPSKCVLSGLCGLGEEAKQVCWAHGKPGQLSNMCRVLLQLQLWTLCSNTLQIIQLLRFLFGIDSYRQVMQWNISV